MISQIDIEKTLQLQPNKKCLFVSLATVLNHVVDAVNKQQIQLNNHECRLLDLHNRITALDDPTYHEAESADNSEKANCQGSVLTMVDNQVTANLPNIDLGELAFLSKENSDLQDELDRTRKVLDRAKWWLNEIVENHRCTPISTAEMALKDITTLEQKD